ASILSPMEPFAPATRDLAPATRTGLLSLAAVAILVMPGLAERPGWAPDDESVRVPAVFLALAVGLVLRLRAVPTRRTALLAALALLPGVLSVLGTVHRSLSPESGAGFVPTETPL